MKLTGSVWSRLPSFRINKSPFPSDSFSIFFVDRICRFALRIIASTGDSRSFNHSRWASKGNSLNFTCAVPYTRIKPRRLHPRVRSRSFWTCSSRGSSSRLFSSATILSVRNR